MKKIKNAILILLIPFLSLGIIFFILEITNKTIDFKHSGFIRVDSKEMEACRSHYLENPIEIKGSDGNTLKIAPIDRCNSEVKIKTRTIWKWPRLRQAY